MREPGAPRREEQGRATALLLERIDRARNGRTDAAISKAAGLHGDFIRDLRRGKKSCPSFENVEALARALGKTPSWLAFASGPEEMTEQVQGPPGGGLVLVPVEPSEGLLLSMALRYDHAIFAPPCGFEPDWWREMSAAQRIDAAVRSMRQLHEEVVGTGFYAPDKEAEYAAMRDKAIARDSEGQA